MPSAARVLQRLNPVDQKIIKDIVALLEDAGRQTQEFSKTTGLHCKAGCGHCCENPEVETTVTEVMPLAIELWAKGEADQILAAIERSQSKGVCVFYKPDPVIAGNGRCSVYARRPGICRLFGFSAKTDKHGKARLLTCKIIKERNPGECARAQKTMDQGASGPLISDFTHKVFGIDPGRGKDLLPINEAVRIAIERTGFACEEPGP